MTLRKKETVLWLIFILTAVFVTFSTVGFAEAKGGRVRDMTKEETVEFYLDQYNALRKKSRLLSNKEKMEEMQVQLFDAIGEVKDGIVKEEYYQQMGDITDQYNRTRKMMKIVPILIVVIVGGVTTVIVRGLREDYDMDSYYDEEDIYDEYEDEYEDEDEFWEEE